MTDERRDSDLHAHFDALKRVDAAHAPNFADMLARVRDESSQGVAVGVRRDWRTVAKRYAWAGGLAAAAAIVALIVLPRGRSADAEFEQAVRTLQASPVLGAWRSPTDGLLDVPGSRLISTTPSVSTVR